MSTFIRADQLAVGHLKELAERTDNWTIVQTMMSTLDEMLGGGFGPGVHFLAGATGISKTAVSLQLARKAADDGFPVYFISLEMQPGDILDRMVSQEMGIRWSDVRAGQFNDEAEEVFWQLSEMPLYFAQQTDDIETLLNELMAMKETPFVIFDYLQIGAERFYKGDPRDRVSSLCARLRDFTEKKKAPMLVISSIARANYSSMKPEPASCLAAAKESGQVEYDATSLSVMLPSEEQTDGPKTGYWVVAKNRFGPQGKIRIIIDGYRGLIEEAEDQTVKEESLDRKIVRLLSGSPEDVDDLDTDGKVRTTWDMNLVVKAVSKRRASVAARVKELTKRGMITLDGRGYCTTAAGDEWLAEQSTHGAVKSNV